MESKNLSSNPSIPHYKQRMDGTLTTNSQETVEVMMEIHNPSCGELDTQTATADDDSLHDISHISIMQNRIQWAVNSFHAFNSSGPDGIILADIQVETLILISISYLRLSYVPMLWTAYKFIFYSKR